MRGLRPNFLECLKSGFLSEVCRSAREDYDLNLEIRENYINLYFKGSALLKLTQAGGNSYRLEIHPKFRAGLDLPTYLTDTETTAQFIHAIPTLKQNILRHGKRSAEVEYEQMLIRANNYEPRNNSEYFVIDRQYYVPTGRFDLTAIYWDRTHRQKNQVVPLCLMELKYALNPDIAAIHDQLQHYYDAIAPRANQMAEEAQRLFRQKLCLELYRQPQDRLEAMKTLMISLDISQYQFILVFMDYNPNSAKLQLDGIKSLPFSSQIKVLKTGFAMWKQNVRPVSQEST